MRRAKQHLEEGIHLVQRLRGLHRRHLHDPRSVTDESQEVMMELIDELDDALVNAYHYVLRDMQRR